MIYQSRWAVYRAWCRAEGHSISRPSISKIADFLLYLHSTRGLSYSAIAGYRSSLSAIFRFVLPDIGSSVVLKDLLRSFSIARPLRATRPPPWDLLLVLRSLLGPPFEPLGSSSFRDLSRKALFLVALASARRVSELQALSSVVSRQGPDLHLTFLPEFLAKTESAARPLPRSFVLRSLGDFAAGLEGDLLLCPVRTMSEYLRRTSSRAGRPRALFVSPRNPLRAISKNAVSFFIRDVISRAYSAQGSSPPSSSRLAHSVRGVATSVSFLRNFKLDDVLQAATWSSPSVFTSFYLSDVQFSSSQGYGLGPFVAAGSVLRS